MRPVQWTALYFALVFAAGVVVGGVSYRVYSSSTVNAESGPREYRKKYMAELTSRLSLAPDQASRIEAILDETRAEYRAFHERHKDELDAIQAGQNRRINELLTPDQQREYALFREERDRRRKAMAK